MYGYTWSNYLLTRVRHFPRAPPTTFSIMHMTKQTGHTFLACLSLLLVLAQLLSQAHQGFQRNLKSAPLQKKPRLATAIPLDLTKCIDNTGWCRRLNSSSFYYSKPNGYLANSSQTTAANTVLERTHAGVESCLANKHIIFIGDSRVRYQMMALLDFLQREEWMRCDDEVAANETSDSCYLINHEHHTRMTKLAWNEWYNQSTQMITSDNQHHVCDCFRPVPFKAQKTVENRFTQRNGAFGNINITYLQNFGGVLQIHSDSFPPYVPLNESSPNRCTPGNCSQPFDSIPLANALSGSHDILERLQPTHVIAQFGWRDHDISCDLEVFAKNHPNIEVMYISHYLTRKGRMSATPRNHTKWMKCNNHTQVFDRHMMSRNVPASWYWDNVHVLSTVNRVANTELLDVLCGVAVVE